MAKTLVIISFRFYINKDIFYSTLIKLGCVQFVTSITVGIYRNGKEEIEEKLVGNKGTPIKNRGGKVNNLVPVYEISNRTSNTDQILHVYVTTSSCCSFFPISI